MTKINGFSLIQITDGLVDTTISTQQTGLSVLHFLKQIPDYQDMNNQIESLKSECDQHQYQLADICDALENIVSDFENTLGEVGHGDRGKAYYETAKQALENYRGES